MTRIVRIAYRYKRPPPRKRKAAALDVPAVVKAAEPTKARKRAKPAPAESTPAAEARKSAIVTIRSRKHAMLAHLLEDLTPEEHRRRGDAADALFREVVRRVREEP
jgi:hypothetical protein